MTTESFLILLVLCVAAFLLLGSNAQFSFTSQHGYLKIVVVAAICFFCLYFNDVYDPFIVSNSREIPYRLVRGLGMACLAMALLYYVIPSSELCRGFLMTGIVSVGISLIAYRHVFIAFSSPARMGEPVIIMGEGFLATALARHIQARPELGIRLLGYLGAPWDSKDALAGVRRMGAIEDVIEVVERLQAKRIIVALGDRRRKLPVEQLLRLKTAGIAIQEGVEFYEVASGKVPVESLRLSWLVFSPGFQVSKLRLLYKRIFSVALAGIGLMLFSPLMALIAFAIWLDSPGPIIFRQDRIGKDGQTFILFKFRTMYVDADAGGDPTPAQANDRRVTRVGRWLRRLRLDEIPQLYNILLGDMYFVGPRPFVPNQELELARQIPLYTQRWTVKPGATGWAQIHRGYCASIEDNKEKLSFDLFYIKNMSIGLDFLIVFKTIKILLWGRGGR